MSHDAEYNKQKIDSKLIGGTITESFIASDGENFFGFRVTNKGKKYNVWIDSDEEGNECGSVTIEVVKN